MYTVYFEQNIAFEKILFKNLDVFFLVSKSIVSKLLKTFIVHSAGQYSYLLIFVCILVGWDNFIVIIGSNRTVKSKVTNICVAKYKYTNRYLCILIKGF